MPQPGPRAVDPIRRTVVTQKTTGLRFFRICRQERRKELAYGKNNI